MSCGGSSTQQRSEGMAWVTLWPAAMSYLGIKMSLDHICFFRWPSAHLKITMWRPMGTTTALLWVLRRKYLLSDLHKPITARKKQNTKLSPGCRSMIMERQACGFFFWTEPPHPPWAEVKRTAIKCLSMVTRVWGCWSRGDDIHFNNYAKFSFNVCKIRKN